MKKYASVSPMFWVRGSGKRLRGNPGAQLVALYLMSCPAASIVGIYPLSLPTLCHETGLDAQGARKALADLEREAFAYWDEDEELVWVPGLPLHQVGDRISVGAKGKKDHRHGAIVKALAPFRNHRFYAQFIERYGLAYLLTEPEEKGAPKGLGSPLCPDPVLSSDPDPDQPDRSDLREPEPPEPPTAAPTRPNSPRPRPADPLRDQLEGRRPYQRADVQRVFARLNAGLGREEARLDRGDIRADVIAERIDEFGEEAALLVAKYAPLDGMVSGRDDNGKKHQSAKYVFGNKDAFERILHDARQREGATAQRRPASELAAKARAL